MNKTTLKIIAGLLLVFLLGVFTGVLGTGFFVRQRIRLFTHGSPREHKNFFIERLSKELELTASQQPKAEQIFQDTEEEIRTFLEDSREQFEALMARHRAELRGILDAGQQEKLDDFFRQMEKRRPGGPPGPPPPTP